ncbi:putative UDP-N-acetylglucosamine diphosphorylase 2 [Nannochloris sp. 'desiccata']|nr:putative UDP-N-acetylglucosamine diphosphorylase 2 [Chlorella desiccata (nom. nud.)]
MEALRQRVTDAGHGHVFEGFDELNDEQRTLLTSQLEDIDFNYVNKIFVASMEGAKEAAKPAEPITDVMMLAATTDDKRALYRATGLQMIAEGKLGLLLLSGGQGTRLGSSAPKGCYNIGLPSGKSLFQLQSERVLRLQRLAVAANPDVPAPKPIRWYIMTSHATDEPTRTFFKENSFFGLDPTQVVFFSQGMLPALTEDGRVIVEAPGKLALAPDGNGGVYTALRSAKILDDMAEHGIEAVDCYSVDNALVRLGDPVFAGFCKEGGIQCGARVVAKAYAEEKVGVFARRGGGMEVVEYSELEPAEASAADPDTGFLRYNWSNVCLHYFERRWLEMVADRLAAEGKFHVAKKQIPSIHGKVPGVKLELFIFDTFSMAEKTALMEVKRTEEFAPVKNAPGSDIDSPDTARAAILKLHRQWIEAAGGQVEGEDGVEISPIVSYAGEGLEWAQGRKFRGPDCSELQIQRE